MTDDDTALLVSLTAAFLRAGALDDVPSVTALLDAEPGWHRVEIDGTPAWETAGASPAMAMTPGDGPDDGHSFALLAGRPTADEARALHAAVEAEVQRAVATSDLEPGEHDDVWRTWHDETRDVLLGLLPATSLGDTDIPPTVQLGVERRTT